MVSLRILMIGLAPIALNACVEIEPATGSPTPTAPPAGIDLGSSGRVPQMAGLAGEGEGYGRTEPNPSPIAQESMPGMSRGSMLGTSHASMDRGSMPGMSQRSPGNMAAPQGSSGMGHGSGGSDTRMAHSGHAHVQVTGTVNSVDAANRKINVSHAPIPTIGWPSMTMDFAVAPSVDLSAVQPGMPVKFDMEQGQGGMYVIQAIAPAEGGRK